jgi:CRP/FNR family transcriptional regulator, cyclic AMP receptor protein
VILGRTQLFGGLDEEILERIAHVTSAHDYGKGDVLFLQGDLGDSLFVIVEGLVKVFLVSEEGSEMVLATLGPHQTFGELALIHGGARSASAMAMAKTTVLTVPRPTFLALVREHASVLQELHNSLGALVRRSLEQASDMVFLDLPGRVAKLLVGLAEERGEEVGGETVLDLQLTQGTLAAMVGGARPTVNQVLHAFESRGYLELRGRRVVLKRLDLLRARAGL